MVAKPEYVASRKPTRHSQTLSNLNKFPSAFSHLIFLCDLMLINISVESATTTPPTMSRPRGLTVQRLENELDELMVRLQEPSCLPYTVSLLFKMMKNGSGPCLIDHAWV